MSIALLLSAVAVAAPAPEGGSSKLDIHTIIGAQAKLHLTKLSTQRQQTLEALVLPEVGQPGPVNKKMSGTFVTSCEDFFAYENGDPHRPVPCSSVAAERIDLHNNVVTDLTIYVNDASCRPNASDVLAKIILYSTIEYAGMSNVAMNRGGKLIKYTPVNGSYLFKYQGPYGEIIQELNTFCPCSNSSDPWESDVQRDLTAADCIGSGKDDPNHMRPGPSDLCNLVKGYPMYQTFKWIDNNHYIQSFGAYDQMEGWAMPMNRSIVNTLLDESGTTNPDYCTYAEWPMCQAGVKNSAAACDSCSSLLECETCIFYEFPSALGKTYEWNYCCPCLYKYADTHNLPWMKVHC